MSDPACTRADLKQASRTRILDAGGARLRMEGLEGAVIAQVMQDAGLTHGAFYSHFADKDELTIAAFRHAITESRQRWVGTTPDRSWGARVARLARSYLSRTHRDDRAESCAFSVLASDAARASVEFRTAFEEELRKSLNAVGDRPLDEVGEHERHDEAIALIALCVGGLSLARAVNDEAFSSRIMKACRTASTKLSLAQDQTTR